MYYVAIQQYNEAVCLWMTIYIYIYIYIYMEVNNEKSLTLWRKIEKRSNPK